MVGRRDSSSVGTGWKLNPYSTRNSNAFFFYLGVGGRVCVLLAFLHLRTEHGANHTSQIGRELILSPTGEIHEQEGIVTYLDLLSPPYVFRRIDG